MESLSFIRKRFYFLLKRKGAGSLRKIHVLLKKEEIVQEKLEDKIVVVLDILLATTTITTALSHGAKEVIPVLNKEEAMAEANDRTEGSFLLVGEEQGRKINGFLSPNPKRLIDKVANKTVILATTNGTVALRKSHAAKRVLVASLLNCSAVVDELLARHKDDTIVVVCSGSSNEFCLEDFYGAGYFIHSLLSKSSSNNWTMTDSALSAYHFYEGIGKNVSDLFYETRVGKMLIEQRMKETVSFACQHDAYEIVPTMVDKKYIRSKNISGAAI